MLSEMLGELRLIYYKLRYGKNLDMDISFRSRSGIRIKLEGGRLRIGKNCCMNHGCSINSLNSITIGDDCIFGENVKFYDHNHRFSAKGVLIREQGYAQKDIVIGNNVWIGSNVVFLAGAHIGDNCVIGAGVVIAAEVPDNSVVRLRQNYTVEEIVYREGGG